MLHCDASSVFMAVHVYVACAVYVLCMYMCSICELFIMCLWRFKTRKFNFCSLKSYMNIPIIILLLYFCHFLQRKRVSIPFSMSLFHSLSSITIMSLSLLKDADILQPRTDDLPVFRSCHR